MSSKYRPGDWTCPNPSCNDHVFAIHQACRRCGTAKPDGKDGSYDGGGGYGYGGGGFGGSGYGGGAMGGGGGVPGGGRRIGDWTCPNPACRDNVFARHQACRKCGAPKPEDRGFGYGTPASSYDAIPAALTFPDPYAGPAAAAVMPYGTQPGQGNYVYGNVAASPGGGYADVFGAMGGGGDYAYGSGGKVGGGGRGESFDRSGSSRPANFRPGDWMCPNPSCRDHVFSFHQTCRRCGADKPPEGREGGFQGGGGSYGGGYGGGGGGFDRRPGAPSNFRQGDWMCPKPDCRDHVFAIHQSCRKCGTPKPAGAEELSASAASIMKSGFRPGDWICPNKECKDHVFSFHSACRKCGTTKPEGVGEEDLFTLVARGEAQASMLKPGDWLCPNKDCGDHVFASRSTCRRCGAVRAGTEGASSSSEMGGGGGGGVLGVAPEDRMVQVTPQDISQLRNGGCLLLTLPADGNLNQGALGATIQGCQSLGLDLEALIRAINPAQHGRAFECGIVLYRVPVPEGAAEPMFSSLYLIHFTPSWTKATIHEMYINLRELLSEMTAGADGTPGAVKRITSTFLGHSDDISRVEVMAEMIFFLQCSSSLGHDLSWTVHMKDQASSKTMQSMVGLKKPPGRAAASTRDRQLNKHPELAGMLSTVVEAIDARWHVFRVCMLDLQRACSAVDSDRDAFPVCIGALRSFEALVRALTKPAAGSASASSEKRLSFSYDSVKALRTKGVLVQHLTADFEEVLRLGAKYAGAGQPTSPKYGSVRDSEASMKAVLHVCNDPAQRDIFSKLGIMAPLTSGAPRLISMGGGGSSSVSPALGRGPSGVGDGSENGGGGGGGGGKISSRSNFREGDWMCPNPACRDHVFAVHSACRRCGASKPGAGGDDYSYHRGGGGGGGGGNRSYSYDEPGYKKQKVLY